VHVHLRWIQLQLADNRQRLGRDASFNSILEIARASARPDPLLFASLPPVHPHDHRVNTRRAVDNTRASGAGRSSFAHASVPITRAAAPSLMPDVPTVTDRGIHAGSLL
jgi:hypothetical protein